MRKLSIADHLFLFLENNKQPMNVAGICLFELPDGAADNFVRQLIHDMQIDIAKPTFPFNQTLHKKLFWKKDNHFHPHNHFRHIVLPALSSMSDLLTYIATQHSRHMDRQKPLWEFHLIEGIAPESAGRPNRFAIYLKLHHTLTDGIAAMRLLQRLLSDNPATRTTLPFWALPVKHKPTKLPPHQPQSLRQRLKNQLDTAKPVCHELLKRWQDRHLSDFVGSFDAPPSLLNQPIQATRYIGAVNFAKDRFTKIAKHFSTTTNDVILAVCSGAIRTYLQSQNALPTKPLIAFVPVSLRKDSSMVGNQLAFLPANLGTDKTEARTRLSVIAKSMMDSKNRFANLSQSQIIQYSLAVYGWAGLNLAMGIYPKKQAFNLVISNIPGIKTPLYLNGAKLTGIYPASVLFDGQALNITLSNHYDRLDFCVTACDVALPKIDTLLGFLSDELMELEKKILQ